MMTGNRKVNKRGAQRALSAVERISARKYDFSHLQRASANGATMHVIPPDIMSKIMMGVPLDRMANNWEISIARGRGISVKVKRPI